MHKAQAAMTDLFIAAFLFLVVFGAMMAMWNTSTARLSGDVAYREMEQHAFQIADFLVKHPGIPSQWKASNVSIAGLGRERQLDAAKVALFLNLSEQQILDMYRIQSYNYSWQLQAVNGAVIQQRGFPAQGNVSVAVSRMVVYNGTAAIMRLTLWH
ncbi:hypothetical protein HY491_04785 [Candidatus Woesearchaeota archaeon]|nr:hypothetical protein [Candidatus Woesearchaeota archaeon]